MMWVIFCLSLLLNGTSALFRLLVPRIVEIEHMSHVKNNKITVHRVLNDAGHNS